LGRKKAERVIDLCCVISGIAEFSKWSCLLLKCTLKCKERRRKKLSFFVVVFLYLSETKVCVQDKTLNPRPELISMFWS